MVGHLRLERWMVAAALVACGCGSQRFARSPRSSAHARSESAVVSAKGTGASARDADERPSRGPGSPGDPVTLVRAGGYHSCVLRRSGEVWCWGRNLEGQLGVPTALSGNPRADNRVRPVRVPLPRGARVLDVALGTRHSCALLESGAVWCWGRNVEGQLGDGSANPSRPNATTGPRVTANFGVAQEIAAGGDTTCARINTGAVHCWGSNSSGQLGLGRGTDNDPHPTPEPTRLNSGSARLALGADHGCAIYNNTVNCWGSNSYGQVGNGAVGGVVATPFSITSLSDIQRVVTGSFFTCARRNHTPAQPDVVCWGSSEVQRLFGATTATGRPIELTGADDIQDVQLGGGHGCALVNSPSGSGQVWCWGWNTWVQTGTGTPLAAQSRLTQVAGLTDVAQISLGYAHSCVRMTTGDVRCWGQNVYGQIGSGRPDNQPHATPTLVAGI